MLRTIYEYRVITFCAYEFDLLSF